jgi:tRNA-specific 2-thiouridylase
VLPLENEQMLVHFLEEASAITPGQSAVFYDGKRVLGGAFIASQRGIHKIIADNPF